MPSFFDDSDSDGAPSPRPEARPRPPAATAGSARAGPGPSSFLNRAISSRHSSPENFDYSQGDRQQGNGGDAFMRGPQDDDDGGDEPEEEGDGEEDTRVRRLMRAWVAERAAPSLLRWEGDIVDDLMHKVEQQTDMVTLLLSETSTSEEEHFKLMLVQTEIERVKFLIRAYLRTRLSKIERFAPYITTTPNIHSLLSPLELSHAKRYNALLASHYHASVLTSLPIGMQSLTEVLNDGTDMVTRPNSKTPVFIWCKKDIGPARLPSGQDADFARGTTHLVRWGMVEQWVKEGRAELI